MRRLKRALRGMELQSEDSEASTHILDNVGKTQLLLMETLDEEHPLPELNYTLDLTNIDKIPIDADVVVTSLNEGNVLVFDQVFEKTVLENDQHNYRAENNKNCVSNGDQFVDRESALIDSLKMHFDRKLEEVQYSFNRKLESVKRSILWDFDKKTNEVKNLITSAPIAAIHQEEDARTTIGRNLPIKTVEELSAFEEELRVDAEKRNALKHFFWSITVGTKSVKDDIAVIMPALMEKAVQLKYSGVGRKTKANMGKLNFSSTISFQCIKEFVEEKFSATATEPLKIVPKISRWLAGASDRAGGRRERMFVNDENPADNVNVREEEPNNNFKKVNAHHVIIFTFRFILEFVDSLRLKYCKKCIGNEIVKFSFFSLVGWCQ